ncbi:hypothetical protein BJQ90_01974 [Arthrobacter sp. SO3]|nr:hypothetical protein [Arthrobacter sp. SO3]
MNRTSATWLASSGDPYLKPKLMTLIRTTIVPVAENAEVTAVERLRTFMSVVSKTTSAALVTARSTSRSELMPFSVLQMMPRSETAVMLATVTTHNLAIGVGVGVLVAMVMLATVTTHNLAIGVGVGVLVAMVMFARRVAHFVTVERTVKTIGGHETATYVVDGELFFASSNDRYTQFEYALDPEHVIMDMHASHLWDAPTTHHRRPGRHHREIPPPRQGREKIVGLNDASILMRERLGGKLGAGQ